MGNPFVTVQVRAGGGLDPSCGSRCRVYQLPERFCFSDALNMVKMRVKERI